MNQGAEAHPRQDITTLTQNPLSLAVQPPLDLQPLHSSNGICREPLQVIEIGELQIGYLHYKVGFRDLVEMMAE
jgi:hypothetical protein